MSIRTIAAILFCLVLGCIAFLPLSMADDWDQMTELHFSQPVEIPGQVLPAGTYWFVLENSSSDRNVVQIYSQDWSQLYATILAVPTYRPQVTDDTEIKFVERPYQRPEALLKWYYPGHTMGHEFLYSDRHEREFARDAKQDVLAEPPPTITSNARIAPEP